MKLIIAGSRTINSMWHLVNAIEQSEFKDKEDITEIVSGGANGVDRLAEIYAKQQNVPFKLFQADWNQYGKSAGPRRNAEMANYGDSLILLWDGKSRGSYSMLHQAFEKGLDIYVYMVKS